jgi:Leucine-rich repeat (LRR) protein
LEGDGQNRSRRTRARGLRAHGSLQPLQGTPHAHAHQLRHRQHRCTLTITQGLNESSKLEALWLNENEICRIDGLDKCTSLKQLYLSHNHIRHIQGLGSLSNLETLWICDNKIEAIENLEALGSLRQLWIAGNQIDCIKTSLDDLVSLTDLNISGNKICSFKEVLNLNRLPNLRVLSFYDPHFGENPICNLCNYQTYVLYHLRNISKLDTLTINEDAKAFAESTLMRKKMYYNMRIKTIERTFSTLSKLIEKAQKIKLDGIN